MITMISLPETPSPLPLAGNCTATFADQKASVGAAQKQLAEYASPDVIAGSYATPANWWLAATILYPKAKRLVFQEDGRWLNVEGETIQFVENSAQQTEAQSPVPTQASVTVQKSSVPEKTIPHRNVTPDLLWETFKLFIFKQSDAETRFQQYLEEAESRQGSEPDLPRRVETVARQGKHAASLADTLDRKFKQGESLEEIRAWKDKVCRSQSPRVVKHLNRTLEKSTSDERRQKALWEKNRNFQVTLPYAQFENGLHPQSLRALSPQDRWEIYIDETGTDFSEGAQARNETDKKLGRVIALALPANHSLSRLQASTHAFDLTHDQVQKLLLPLMKSNIGILGATLKKDLHSHNWLAATAKLVRWVVLMLPVDGEVQVNFKIENRGGYKDSRSLLGLEEALVDELRQLSPERFGKMQLSLAIVGKDAPYNGYVDVIANCWGSSDDTKRRLLARTGWRGHCLLQSTDLAEADRLYQAVDSDPDADTWFLLCQHLAKEPGHSMFHDLLAKLGETAIEDSKIWQRYLVGVRQRISHKDFDAGSLGRALAWLKQYQPTGEQLPGLLELQLASAQLAADNHMGHSSIQQVGRVMALAERLRDEAAPDACEAALRVAISATNSFDFESAVPYIENWLSQPVAVPGRLNYGKLHSTLGQLKAFRGLYEAATDHFTAALEHFAELSDPLQARSNQQQTSSYNAIVLLDMGAPEAVNVINGVISRATGRKGSQAVRQLARSSSPLRFEHYLLLRWLVAHPEETQSREEYLAHSDDWQVGEGHPWMLINAYRGWLLTDAKRAEEATGFLARAIEECSESEGSVILHWMAHCLYSLGKSLGIEVEAPLRPCPSEPFPKHQLSALENAASNASRVEALGKLLPFNFH